VKQKDLALIIVITVVSAVLSFILSNKIFVTPSNRQQKVEVVDDIKSKFDLPNPKYFNTNSIDPTQQTHPGSDNNQNPFNGAKP
jgi:hypothetical protein